MINIHGNPPKTQGELFDTLHTLLSVIDRLQGTSTADLLESIWEGYTLAAELAPSTSFGLFSADGTLIKVVDEDVVIKDGGYNTANRLMDKLDLGLSLRRIWS